MPKTLRYKPDAADAADAAEDRAFWAHCEAVAGEVSLWPGWMRGEEVEEAEEVEAAAPPLPPLPPSLFHERSSGLRCGNAGRYKGILPPTCNTGDPCQACRDKYAANHLPTAPSRPSSLRLRPPVSLLTHFLRPVQKLKARDVVAGWPRGRSTSPMFQDWQYETLWTGFWTGLCSVVTRQKADEHKRDYDYHRGQADLVTTYRGSILGAGPVAAMRIPRAVPLIWADRNSAIVIKATGDYATGYAKSFVQPTRYGRRKDDRRR
jgi:hypothetical protein